MLKRLFIQTLRYMPFLSVGAIAAMVHYWVALAGFYWVGGMSASSSNWLGFLMAFPVSYLGHRYWTFSATQVSHGQALLKFSMVALLSFQGNQALLWLTLKHTPLPFWLVLGVVMVLVAVITYVLSRRWVFKYGK